MKALIASLAALGLVAAPAFAQTANTSTTTKTETKSTEHHATQHATHHAKHHAKHHATCTCPPAHHAHHTKTMHKKTTSTKKTG